MVSRISLVHLVSITNYLTYCFRSTPDSLKRCFSLRTLNLRLHCTPAISRAHVSHCIIACNLCSDLPDEDYLVISTYTQDDTFIGQATISQLQTLQPLDEVIEKWFDLVPKPGSKKDGSKGSLRKLHSPLFHFPRLFTYCAPFMLGSLWSRPSARVLFDYA
jgi:hypothetical protein